MSWTCRTQGNALPSDGSVRSCHRGDGPPKSTDSLLTRTPETNAAKRSESTQAEIADVLSGAVAGRPRRNPHALPFQIHQLLQHFVAGRNRTGMFA